MSARALTIESKEGTVQAMETQSARCEGRKARAKCQVTTHPALGSKDRTRHLRKCQESWAAEEPETRYGLVAGARLESREAPERPVCS